jgi:hypothetical protein
VHDMTRDHMEPMTIDDVRNTVFGSSATTEIAIAHLCVQLALRGIDFTVDDATEHRAQIADQWEALT